MKTQPIATWNPQRDLWETDQVDIFGNTDAYTDTLPKSGSIRNGKLFAKTSWAEEHPNRNYNNKATSSALSTPTMQAVQHPINADSGEGTSDDYNRETTVAPRVLPTPVAHPSGNSPEDHLRKKPGRKVVTDLSIIVENNLMETGGEIQQSHDNANPNTDSERLFPTPKASDGIMGRPRTTGRPIEQSTNLCTIVTLLPTPNTMDSLPAREGEARERQLHRGDMNSSRRSSMGNLREDILEIAPENLPTPQARDGNCWGGQHPDYRRAGNHQACLPDAATIMGEGSETPHVSPFGRYAEAVERWEKQTRPAPPPTEYNSRNKPRLAAPFAEWMMGLPEGWVTSNEIGLTRAQQLKAIGNGVVPQQAAAAISFLLNRAIDSIEN